MKLYAITSRNIIYFIPRICISLRIIRLLYPFQNNQIIERESAQLDCILSDIIELRSEST